MSELKDKLESLKQQQEQARELFIKCQGAIEVLTEIINEKDEKKK